ncbi:hypothetical protein [Flavobacterium sp.]|uniref:hypothetical protein n=1 Tax=Flavobacterium sp. TaxID=239 RepID=UPI003751E243
MKKYIYIFIILLASCKSKQPVVPKIEEVKKPEVVVVKLRYVKMKFAEVNTLDRNRAYNLGKRLLETCNTSKFKAFSKEEATEKVILNATVEKISKTCQKINARNGKFIDLNLIEVIHDTETDSYNFIYKIAYEKKYFERELYVTINSDGKVSAISTKEIPVSHK